MQVDHKVGSGILRGINKRGPSGMNTPGSVMTAKINDHHSPLVYGYNEITHVFRGNGPVFSLPDYDRRYSPLQFGTKHWDEDLEEDNGSLNPPLVMSGGIVQGANIIDGEPAIVSKPLDEGQAW